MGGLGEYEVRGIRVYGGFDIGVGENELVFRRE